MTLAIVLILSMLFWGELRAYIWGEAAFTFDVEHHIGQDMQINVDMTVAMQCHCELMRPSDEPPAGCAAKLRAARGAGCMRLSGSGVKHGVEESAFRLA